MDLTAMRSDRSIRSMPIISTLHSLKCEFAHLSPPRLRMLPRIPCVVFRRHQMPFSPPIHRRYEQPEPMDSLRSLAISLEEEDRADLGGYIAVVLQKLANMNELFLGERVRWDCRIEL